LFFSATVSPIIEGTSPAVIDICAGILWITVLTYQGIVTVAIAAQVQDIRRTGFHATAI
jgi:hypothetical protein